jgi:hypothetical protein
MNRIPRIFFVLALTLILAFGAPTAAHAQGIIYGDTIPAGTVVDHDVVLIGQAVAMDGTVNGNVFILGNQITVNGTVDGSVVLIGQNASIGGVVTGAVYAAALTLNLAPNASLERDLYVVTVSLTSGKDSVITRDLYAVGLDSGLNGQVGRDLHTVIGPIQLYNGLMTLIGFPDLTIKLHFEVPQPTDSGSGSLLTPGRHARIVAVEQIKSVFDWAKWGLALLRSWAVLFVFSLLLFWLAHKPLNRSGEQIGAAFWRALGTGLIVLVIAFALFGVAALVAVLIFAIGLGLNFIGLWQISIALWAAAYACLVLLVVALWFFITYATKIIAVYFASTSLFMLMYKRKALWLNLLALLAGTVIYALLRSVPYVGWVFGVLATAIGAGAAWIAYRQGKPVKVPIKKKK